MKKRGFSGVCEYLRRYAKPSNSGRGKAAYLKTAIFPMFLAHFAVAKACKTSQAKRVLVYLVYPSEWPFSRWKIVAKTYPTPLLASSFSLQPAKSGLRL